GARGTRPRGPRAAGAGDRPPDVTELDITGSGPPAAAAGGLSFLEPSGQPGTLGRFLHYEVQQVLGQGGFGVVLKALDDRLQRVVAIKVLSPQLADNPTAPPRFLREARAAAAVRPPHVGHASGVAGRARP